MSKEFIFGNIYFNVFILFINTSISDAFFKSFFPFCQSSSSLQNTWGRKALSKRNPLSFYFLERTSVNVLVYALLVCPF